MQLVAARHAPKTLHKPGERQARRQKWVNNKHKVRFDNSDSTMLIRNRGQPYNRVIVINYYYYFWVDLAHIPTHGQSMMCPLTNPRYCINLYASEFEYSVTPDLLCTAPVGERPTFWPKCASLKSSYYIVICPAVWWAVTLLAVSPHRLLINWNDKIIMCCGMDPYHNF